MKIRKKLHPAKETSQAVSICEKTLWNKTWPRGPIPSYRVGSRVLYDLDEVVEAIKKTQRLTDDELADKVSDALARNPMLRKEEGELFDIESITGDSACFNLCGRTGSMVIEVSPDDLNSFGAFRKKVYETWKINLALDRNWETIVARAIKAGGQN